MFNYLGTCLPVSCELTCPFLWSFHKMKEHARKLYEMTISFEVIPSTSMADVHRKFML